MGKYYPGLNKVLVKEKELPKVESILSSSKNLLNFGEIVAVGAIKDRKDIEEGYQKGDEVYFLAQAGLPIELPEGNFKLLNVTEILLGITKEN